MNTSQPESVLKSLWAGFMLVGMLAVGCSGPHPILYPNDHLQEVGQAQADQDIAQCREFASNHVASHTGETIAGSTAVGAGGGAVIGAVGGAITGSAGTNAAIGAATGATAGLLHGLFHSSTPSRAYRRFVDRCLEERGYESMGWE